MRVAPIASWHAVLVLGCASSDPGSAPDANGPGGDGAPEPADAGPDGGGPSAACPDGQFATGIAAGGDLTCAAIDAATATAVRARCSVYAGFRDSCDGCTDPPAECAPGGAISGRAGRTCLGFRCAE